MSTTFSFIVISYNRPQDTLNVCQNILDLFSVTGYNKEIIIINNGSSDDYTAFENYLKQLSPEERALINYIDSESNLGVAGGRNLGIEQSTGDYLVFIDDDALFNQRNTLQLVLNRFEKYEDSEQVKIIAFLEHRVHEKKDYPSTKSKTLAKEEEFFTNYFIGCGHCIKREVFDEVGLYDASFFYGVEEYDLAYKVLDAGYRILYTSKISVNHFLNAAGRESNKQKMERMFLNKMVVAQKYLPKKYVRSHFWGWSWYYLKNTGFNFWELLKLWFKWKKEKSKVNRKELKPSTVQYIKKVEGRLRY